MASVAIIDYGMGNLRSVQKGLEYVDEHAFISSDPQEILSATHVVLPGVGAFSDAMDNIRNAGLVETIKEIVERKTPFLGICLGMQLLFDLSYEGGKKEGLGIIPGEIVKISEKPGLKIPHMGWNTLKYKDCKLFSGIGSSPHVYFVHSYHISSDDKYVIATTDYGSEMQVAANIDNVWGVQFHPEKSGMVGLKILRNFGEMK